MKISNTELPGVLRIEYPIFEDHRGQFIETYNQELFASKIPSVKFVQDDISVSKKNVLRGIHGDFVTYKLASCLHGQIYIVIVNCDQGSGFFGKWQSFDLTRDNYQQLLIPPGYGVAHLAISDEIVFHYKQSTYYHPELQFTYKWNDSRFNIKWPINNPILSQRDS